MTNFVQKVKEEKNVDPLSLCHLLWSNILELKWCFTSSSSSCFHHLLLPPCTFSKVYSESPKYLFKKGFLIGCKFNRYRDDPFISEKKRYPKIETPKHINQELFFFLKKAQMFTFLIFSDTQKKSLKLNHKVIMTV